MLVLLIFLIPKKVRGKLMKTRKRNLKPSSLWTFHLINNPSLYGLNMIRLRLGLKMRGKTQNEFDFGSVNPHAWIYVFPCGGCSANDKVTELSYFPCGSSTWHDSSVYINFGFSSSVVKIRIDREKIHNRFFSEGIFRCLNSCGSQAMSFQIQLVESTIKIWFSWNFEAELLAGALKAFNLDSMSWNLIE